MCKGATQIVYLSYLKPTSSLSAKLWGQLPKKEEAAAVTFSCNITSSVIIPDC